MFVRPKAAVGLALVLALLIGLSAAVSADDKTAEKEKAKQEEKKDWKIRWEDGFKFDSPDGDFKLKFGGRLQNDWMWGSGEDAVETEFGKIVSGNEFRRARLFFEGTVYKAVEFKVQYDFAGGDADFKDVYIGFTNLPFGKLRIGHYKEPFSLEELTSSKYISFLERALPNVFAPSRNTGFGVLGHSKSERMTWGLGVFTDADDYGEAKAHDDTYNFSGRVTFLPWAKDKDILHLGAAYHYQGVNEGGSLRYRERPEAHLTNRFVDTHGFAADSASIVGLEAAGVMGPFSFQAEYMVNYVSASDYGDPTLSGGYVFGSYFLTPGDKRNYKKTEAAFDRVKPKNPYLGSSGMGAWEVLVRYSRLDLTDAPLAGGELSDITLGLNWYPNNVTRVMLNYVYADRDGIGTANFFMMRFQIDF